MAAAFVESVQVLISVQNHILSCAAHQFLVHAATYQSM